MTVRDWAVRVLGGRPASDGPRRDVEPVLVQPEARLTVPEVHPGQTRWIILPQQLGGVAVTEDTAIQLAAVWGCVSWISKSIASSDWDVFRRNSDGTRTKIEDRHWDILNVVPNPETISFNWRFTALWQALLHGNHYSEIERDELGRPHFLWDLDPNRVDPDRDADTNLVYRVTNPMGPPTFLPARDVFHISGPGDSSLVGHSLIRVAARVFGTSIASDTFAASYFGNMLMPGLIVEHEGNLTEEQRKQQYEGMNARLGGPTKAFGTLISEGGGKVKSLSATPEAAQAIEHRQHLIEDVCRFFGVPPQKVQHLLRMTFDNIEELNLDAVRDGLTQWTERLRQEADKKLLPPGRRLRTRINLDWLTEGNAKDRAEADNLLVFGGVQTINEVRTRRGLNKSSEANADVLLVQSAMTTLDKIGQDAAPEPASPPQEPDEGRLRVVETP